jgi:6,7-dimethyl-8-ribityllumazine synthase
MATPDLIRDLPAVDLARFGVRTADFVAAAGARVAVVAARYNAPVVERLVEGALTTLAGAGITRERTLLVRVPGAWELPQAALALAERGLADAIVALGCVIRGETGHYEVIVNESARGLGEVALATGVPVANGVLACEDAAQALARAGGVDGNKGSEAAQAALEMCALIRGLDQDAEP